MSSNSNLLILYKVAKELDELRDSLVFVGGTVVSLYVTEPEIVDIRETFDVDTIVEVIGRVGYVAFAEKLRKKGFVEDIESKILCRYILPFSSGSENFDLLGFRFNPSAALI